jgi:hypothetical protein
MSDQDFQAMEQMTEQELYRVIGYSVAATDSISSYNNWKNSLMAVASETDPVIATEQLDSISEAEGKSWFEKIKKQLKIIICDAYAIVTGTQGPNGPIYDILKLIWDEICTKIAGWPALAVKAALCIIGKLTGFDSYCALV